MSRFDPEVNSWWASAGARLPLNQGYGIQQPYPAVYPQYRPSDLPAPRFTSYRGLGVNHVRVMEYPVPVFIPTPVNSTPTVQHVHHYHSAPTPQPAPAPAPAPPPKPPAPPPRQCPEFKWTQRLQQLSDSLLSEAIRVCSGIPPDSPMRYKRVELQLNPERAADMIAHTVLNNDDAFIKDDLPWVRSQVKKQIQHAWAIARGDMHAEHGDKIQSKIAQLDPNARRQVAHLTAQLDGVERGQAKAQQIRRHAEWADH